MEIRTVNMSKLNPALYNPRKDLAPGDIEYEKLKKSILAFGEVDPIIWNEKTGNIVGGHQRFKVLRDMGQEDFDVSVVSLDIAQEGALNIALNKISGEWDYPKLKDLIAEIDTGEFDIGITGFDAEELKELFGFESKAGETEDDAIPEDVEPICKTGDLYRLGDHRLLCGDATSKDDVERLMDGKKADMVFTDPPYGMNLDTDYSKMSHRDDFKKSKGVKDSKEYRPVIGDDKPFDIGIFDWINCKEQFWWGADYYRKTIPGGGSWFVWDKRTEDNFDKMYGNTFELCFSMQVHKRMVLRIRWCGIFGSEQELGSNRVHPTQKPIQLCQWFIDKYSKPGDCILDLFGGSGSTLIACEKLDRKCYMMEIDPHYNDVIIKRWEDFTGGKAEKI